MHIEFARADEEYIKESVKNGYFRSEAEAVRAAVRSAREQNESKRLRLLEALQLGEDDIVAGRTVPYSRELMTQMRQKAAESIENMESQAGHDVIP
jgi:putative addiction module CopG family antidote